MTKKLCLNYKMTFSGVKVLGITVPAYICVVYLCRTLLFIWRLYLCCYQSSLTQKRIISAMRIA